MSFQCRILVIDGDDSIREFITMALAAEGYHVAVARSEEDGLALIPQFNPDMIVLDMHMSLDGLIEFLQICHGGYSGVDQYIPVIGLSTSTKATELAEQSGIDELLTKPFDLDDLLALCNQFASAVNK